MFHIKNILNRMMSLSLLASVGFAALLSLAQTDAALAATAPSLGTASTYGIVSSTFTNNANVAPTTRIIGDVCYTTGNGSAFPPTTITGTTAVPCAPAVGVDQGLALANLNTQALAVSCTTIAAGTPMDAVVIGANPPGTFPPGCYRFLGALDITASTTVTLNGAGVYIFSSVGALTTGADSKIALVGGVCESDVFWAPGAAATIGAFTTGGGPALTPTFVGNIIDNAGITIGHFANLRGRALDFATTVTTDANTITVPTCVPFVPGVAPTISKVFNPATINAPTGVSTLTFTLSNANATALTGVGFNDTYPAGLTNTNPAVVVNGCGGTVVGGGPGGTTIGLSGGTIAANGSCTISVDVTSTLVNCYNNVSGAVTSDQGTGNSASATLCVIALTQPLLITQVSSPGVPVGAEISDTATLSHLGTNPIGGTITFYLYGPNNAACAGLPIVTVPVGVSGDGNYFSGSFHAMIAGTYRWIANYSGDASNSPVTNTCNALNETVVVAKLTPALTTQASSGVTLGAAISDTATLSGGATPTGTITFSLYGPNNATCAGVALFTSTVTVAGNGSYSSTSFTPTTAGTYCWIANYGGDANNAATANTCNAANESVVVSAAPLDIAAPTLSEWGMIIFMVLVGLMSIYYLRRQKAKA